MSRASAGVPRSRGLSGCLLSWLAGMLLIGSVPYLAIYMGFMPGVDVLDEAGIDVRSPVGAAVAAVGLVVALTVLGWCFWNMRRGKR